MVILADFDADLNLGWENSLGKVLKKAGKAEGQTG
jgi:hypothetical protein